MATARGEEYDKINGLDSGADDYLVKPFGMMEMVSRVRAVLRRSNPERTERAMEFHGITIDPASHRVTANGREVTLTLKEYELLHALMASPGVVFTRDRRSARSGARTTTARPAPWTSTSAPSARSWATRARPSAPCAASVTGWRREA